MKDTYWTRFGAGLFFTYVATGLATAAYWDFRLVTFLFTDVGVLTSDST